MKKVKYSKGSFIIVPNKDLLKGLKPNTQVIYMWICNFSNDDGKCFPSIKTLTIASGVGRSKVFICLEELENLGLITRESRKIGKKNLTNIYQVNIIEEEDVSSPPYGLPSPQDGRGVVQEMDGELNPIYNSTTELKATHGVADIIKAFEAINPACKKMYGNTTQRKACEDLIANFTLERVVTVVEKTLPRTNEKEFFPTITTPVQLMQKWPTLENAIKKYKNRALNQRPKVIL